MVSAFISLDFTNAFFHINWKIEFISKVLKISLVFVNNSVVKFSVPD